MTEETYEDAALILRRTKYYSGVFEREITEVNGVTNEREINFIFAPDGLAAIYEKKNGTGNMYYVSTDNLGSINIIADAQGNIVNDLSYDAWGRRRNPYTWEQLTVAQTKALQPTLITDRGYTLHEHMDAFGLINMNGRAYDPLVGQFLSPDPFVQSATSTQSYNRYSYCWNNPLKFVDPSGYLGSLTWIDIQARNYAWGASNKNVDGIWFNTYWYEDQSQAFKSTLKLAIELQKQGNHLILQKNDDGYHIVYGVKFGQATTKSSYGSLSREEAVLMCNLLNNGRQKDDNPYESHVMSQSWENNRDNPMRDVGMMHMGVYPGPSSWMRDFNRAFGTTLNAGMAAGLAPIVAPALLEAAPRFALKYAGWKFLGSSLVQLTVNQRVDVFDATLDAVTLPGLSRSTLGGFVDMRVSNNGFTFRTLGIDKTMGECLYDSGARYLFSSFGGYMNNQIGSTVKNGVDNAFYNFGTYYLAPTILNTVNKGVKNDIF